MRAGWWLAGLLLLGSGTLEAARYAVMSAGTRVRIDRCETAGSMSRLYLVGGGFVEVPAESIRGFESDEYTPPPPAAPRAGAAVQAGELNSIVETSGERHGLDPDLIHSVIRAESGGNPQAVSPKGAGGLMQLMPATARDLNVADVFDPAQNIDAGTRYLRQLLATYNNDLILALAAYNAGPEKVAAYRGVPPYPETRNYVSRVIRDFNRKKTAVRPAQ